MTTDTRPKEAVVARDGFVVGGMAKGAGMIHPALGTMLAVVTTDYPLGRAEADAFLRPAVEATFNRISVDGDARRTMRCSCSRTARAAAPGTTRASPPRSARSAPTSLRRSSPTARARRCCSRSTSPARPPSGGDGRRPPHRHLAARQDGGVRPRRELGPGAGCRRLGAVQRRLREPRPGLVSLRFNGTSVFAAGAPTAHEPAFAGTVCRIELDLGLGGAPPRISPPT